MATMTPQARAMPEALSRPPGGTMKWRPGNHNEMAAG
jgi:hypothetical protein